jgi:hypothetical protein
MCGHAPERGGPKAMHHERALVWCKFRGGWFFVRKNQYKKVSFSPFKLKRWKAFLIEK